jgi:hypothetical protein
LDHLVVLPTTYSHPRIITIANLKRAKIHEKNTAKQFK